MHFVSLSGSGKQSLVGLSAHLVGFGGFQVTLANNYGLMEFNPDHVKALLRTDAQQPTVFLLTDSQVIDERTLIPISHFLSTGVLRDISAHEDKELVYSAVKGDMKVQAIQFAPEEAMKFFTDRI